MNHLRKLGIIFISLLTISTSAQFDDPEYNESCTSIMVGKKASTDGSVMTAHTCDAYYRTWLEFVPQKFEKDTTVAIRWGTMHTHTAWSNENIEVKPDKKVDIRDVLALYRTTYDGTEFKMIRNIKIENKKKDKEGKETIDTIVSPSVHPWMDRDKRKMLNTLKKDIVYRERPIAVQYCAYSFVVQLRDWLPDEIGGRLLFSIDIPRLSPRFPIYAGNLDLPKSYKIDNQDHFSRDAAGWAFRRANHLAMVKWGEGKKIIEPLVKEYEDRLFSEIEYIEKKALELKQQDEENAKNGKESKLCREFLTKYTNDFARTVKDRWWELGDELWVKFRWKF